MLWIYFPKLQKTNDFEKVMFDLMIILLLTSSVCVCVCVCVHTETMEADIGLLVTHACLPPPLVALCPGRNTFSLLMPIHQKYMLTLFQNLVSCLTAYCLLPTWAASSWECVVRHTNGILQAQEVHRRPDSQLIAIELMWEKWCNILIIINIIL